MTLATIVLFYEGVIQASRKSDRQGNTTAILNTGIFPGISNSMVKQGVEQFDRAKKIHLSYVVAGSGGAGLTVMRTTFSRTEKHKFSAWIDGRWQDTLPYTEREVIEFPQPYGKTGVYWFDVPETYTFADSFPVDTVVTKFGSIPDWYNHLTWITAHIFPEAWVSSPKGIEFFSQVSYLMTKVTDRFSGIGVAMRAEITGEVDGEAKPYCHHHGTRKYGDRRWGRNRCNRATIIIRKIKSARHISCRTGFIYRTVPASNVQQKYNN